MVDASTKKIFGFGSSSIFDRFGMAVRGLLFRRVRELVRILKFEGSERIFLFRTPPHHLTDPKESSSKVVATASL